LQFTNKILTLKVNKIYEFVEDGKPPVSAIMYIWNSGDMAYRVEK